MLLLLLLLDVDIQKRGKNSHFNETKILCMYDIILSVNCLVTHMNVTMTEFVTRLPW